MNHDGDDAHGHNFLREGSHADGGGYAHSHDGSSYLFLRDGGDDAGGHDMAASAGHNLLHSGAHSLPEQHMVIATSGVGDVHAVVYVAKTGFLLLGGLCSKMYGVVFSLLLNLRDRSLIVRVTLRLPKKCCS